ncbi:MAG: glycine betaine ABC transporter substrate-binding protein [Rubrobacteraceae bacterium]
MKKRSITRAFFAMLGTAAMLLALVACGGGSGGEGDKGNITVGSKNFTEQLILGQMYAQALEADGFSVDKNLNLGSVEIADQALQSGEIDMYPEYTGTALETVLDYKKTGELESPEATYEKAQELYSERDPADTMLQQADFNNTYGIAVRKEVADEYGIKTLGDLAEASPNLVFASFSEFQERSDGFPNIEENYDVNFKDIKIVNSLGNRYKALAQGDADVAVGFTTDGQLNSDKLVVAEDEKKIWPFYYPAPVFRSEVIESLPDAEEVVNSVSESLDLKTMRELNGQVDIDNRDPEDVAREYLEQEGLLN